MNNVDSAYSKPLASRGPAGTSMTSLPPAPPQLYSNPFASRYLRAGELAFRLVDDGATGDAELCCTVQRRDFVDVIVARLREVRCGAIIGDHGTGKSTLLRELAGRLDREMSGGAWVQLTQSNRVSEILGNVLTVSRCLRAVAPGGVLVIDGAEQLPAIVRQWIARKSQRARQFVLVTSHHNLAGFATLHRTKLSPALINGLVSELLSDANRHVSSALRAHLQSYLKSVKLGEVRNLRDLWNELYEVAESYDAARSAASSGAVSSDRKMR